MTILNFDGHHTAYLTKLLILSDKIVIIIMCNKKHNKKECNDQNCYHPNLHFPP